MRHLSRYGLAVLAVAAGPLAAEEASPWAAGHRSRARMIAGEEAGAARWAGIEIALDRGFKTYWRHPGESGLPPAFDWSGSDNLAAVEVLWPAPRRFDDAGGVAYGWEGGVVLPLRVTPREPGRPVRLALRFDYGVCKDICIPARAELALSLEPGGNAASPANKRALAAVPEPRAVGAAGDLAVMAVKPTGGEKPGLAVTLRAPAGGPPLLFAEGPEGWLLSTPARPPSWFPDGATTVTVPVAVDERPAGAAGPVAIRLTVTAGGYAIETEARLDAAALAPRLDGPATPR